MRLSPRTHGPRTTTSRGGPSPRFTTEATMPMPTNRREWAEEAVIALALLLVVVLALGC